MTMPLFIGGLGPPELLLIAGVLILLFGASKLPKLARSMGSATGEFKKGREEVEGELEELKSGPDAADPESTPRVNTDDTDSDADLDAEAERDTQSGA